MYEFVLLFLGFIIVVFVFLNKNRKNLIPFYFSGLLVATLCVYIDFYVGEVTYYAKVLLPFTKFPLSMIFLGAIYFCTLLYVQKVILQNIKVNIFLKTIFRVIVIAVLNFSFLIIDFIIVRTGLCVFHNEKIQSFFYHLDLSSIPRLYFISAYIFFLLGTILTGLLYLVFCALIKQMNKWHLSFYKGGKTEIDN